MRIPSKARKKPSTETQNKKYQSECRALCTSHQLAFNKSQKCQKESPPNRAFHKLLVMLFINLGGPAVPATPTIYTGHPPRVLAVFMPMHRRRSYLRSSICNILFRVTGDGCREVRRIRGTASV